MTIFQDSSVWVKIDSCHRSHCLSLSWLGLSLSVFFWPGTSVSSHDCQLNVSTMLCTFDLVVLHLTSPATHCPFQFRQPRHCQLDHGGVQLPGQASQARRHYKLACSPAHIIFQIPESCQILGSRLINTTHKTHETIESYPGGGTSGAIVTVFNNTSLSTTPSDFQHL